MRVKILFVMLIFVFSNTIAAKDKNKEPGLLELTKGENGVYYSYMSVARGRSVAYIVDTVAQLCSQQHGRNNLSLVPCGNLKKRPEWKDIITW